MALRKRCGTQQPEVHIIILIVAGDHLRQAGPQIPDWRKTAESADFHSVELSNPDKTKDWAAMVPVTPQILGVSGQQGLRISIAQIA